MTLLDACHEEGQKKLVTYRGPLIDIFHSLLLEDLLVQDTSEALGISDDKDIEEHVRPCIKEFLKLHGIGEDIPYDADKRVYWDCAVKFVKKFINKNR